MRYGDLIRRYVTDNELWFQTLQDERYRCQIEKKRPHPIPWLLESYKRMEKSIRELEAPPDRNPAHQLQQRGEGVDFKQALEPLPPERRAEMLRIYEEARSTPMTWEEYNA